MRNLLLLSIIGSLFSPQISAQDDSTKTIKLQNYNEWNLPFAATFQIEASEDEPTYQVPQGKYLLEIDPAAFFTILFVDASL